MNTHKPEKSSWDWVKRGVSSLNQKPSLLALPVLDCSARLIIWSLAWYMVVSGWKSQGIGSPWVFILIPAWLFASFVKSYFSISLAHALLMKSEDEDRLLSTGMTHTSTMKWNVAKWGWLDSVAALVLSINGTRGLFGQVITALGGMSWKMATLLTPALLARGRKTIQAIEQSSEIVMSRLGGTAISTAGLWGVFHLIQGTISFLGFIGVWALIMVGHPMAGITVGLGAGLLTLAVRAYESAVMVAFSVEILNDVGLVDL